MSDQNTVKENTENEKMGEHDKVVVEPPADIPEKKNWVSFEDSNRQSMIFLWSTIGFTILLLIIVLCIGKSSSTGPNSDTPKTISLSFLGDSKSEINRFYKSTIIVTNAKEPVEYNITSGKLPPGLAFSQATAEIYGTPKEEGIYEFTVAISDSDKKHAEKKVKLEIIPEPLKLLTHIITASDDQMYFKKLKAVGGTPNYSFELISGHFPPVLGISPSGEIIGQIPKNTKGTWTFKIKITDSKNNSISELINFTVKPTKISETKKLAFKKEKEPKKELKIDYDFNLTKLRQMEKNLSKFYPQLEKNGITLKKVKISKFTTNKVKIQYYQSLKKLSDIQKGYNMSDNGKESIKELAKKIQEHQTETQDLYNYFQQMEKI